MSKALSFGRLGSVAGHKSLAARPSSTWYKRKAEVLQAITHALTLRRTDIDTFARSYSGSDATATATATTIDGEHEEGRKPLSKGKGRAVSADLATNNDTTTNLAEIQNRRPVSDFVSTYHSSRDEPQASTSTASHRTHEAVEAGALSGPPLPQTPLEARSLVYAIAMASHPLANIRSLLTSVQDASLSVELAVLETCLGFPVIPAAHWNKEGVAQARKEAKSVGNRKGSRLFLDESMFYSIWTRLWSLADERLTLPPGIAALTLKRIITIPSPLKMNGNAEASRSVTALRQLMFLAGLKENSTLAVMVLGHVLHRNLYCDERLMAHGQLAVEETLPSDKTLPDAKDFDTVRILQDLLRSGVLSPDIVNRFGLTKLLTREATLGADVFESLFKQTLLRTVLQYHIDHDEEQHIFKVWAVIKPLDGGNPSETLAASHRDSLLLLDAIQSNMRNLRYEQRDISATARNILQLLDILAKHPLPLETRKGTHEPSLQMLRGLLRDFFKILLSPEHVPPANENIAREAVSLWAATMKIDPDLCQRLPLSQLAHLLQIFSAADTEQSQGVIIEVASLIVNTTLKMLHQGAEIENGLANEILGSLLKNFMRHSRANRTHLRQVQQIYEAFVDSSRMSGNFSLQGRYLRDLVNATKVAEEQRIEGRDASRVFSPSAIINQFMKTRKAWKSIPHSDYTALAGALIDNEEYGAALQVLRQLYKMKEVPTLADVELCLKALEKVEPGRSREIMQGPWRQGLSHPPETDEVSHSS